MYGINITFSDLHGCNFLQVVVPMKLYDFQFLGDRQVSCATLNNAYNEKAIHTRVETINASMIAMHVNILLNFLAFHARWSYPFKI